MSFKNVLLDWQYYTAPVLVTYISIITTVLL